MRGLESKVKDYILYRGEDALIVGTAKEIANYLGTSINNVYSIKNRTAIRTKEDALRVFEIEEGDEE